MSGIRKTTLESRYKKAKRGLTEAQRKKKAVATRLMNIRTKQGTEKGGRKETYPGAGPERTRRESRGGKVKIVNKKWKKGDPLVIVGEKQWQEYLKFSKRKRSDKKS
ncbi:MAG: hypothetical protein CMB80_02540 [Flammeovirgaceae bacterium]|nr:hypothetical protein [Flammeovirgaceae bacterium]